jgi:transaldolase
MPRSAAHRQHDPRADLLAFYDHGHAGKQMPADGGDSEATLTEFASVRSDADALGARLQSDGATSFVDAWNDLMTHIDQLSAGLRA